MWGWEDLYGRPRPVHHARILREHDRLPTPRATLKALPSPRPPPSPLRVLMSPVHRADNLEEHEHSPTPRATIKALPAPRPPPSPLRMVMGGC